jgi:hypothetical protein
MSEKCELKGVLGVKSYQEVGENAMRNSIIFTLKQILFVVMESMRIR